MQGAEFTALVRAFGDEPRKLRAGRDDHGGLLVYGADSDECIPYPSEFVFEFEQELFADLAAAFASRDQQALSALWSRASRLTH